MGQVLFTWNGKEARALALFDANHKLVTKCGKGEKTDIPVGEYTARVIIPDGLDGQVGGFYGDDIVKDIAPFTVSVQKDMVTEINR